MYDSINPYFSKDYTEYSTHENGQACFGSLELTLSYIILFGCHILPFIGQDGINHSGHFITNNYN